MQATYMLFSAVQAAQTNMHAGNTLIIGEKSFARYMLVAATPAPLCTSAVQPTGITVSCMLLSNEV